MKINYTDADGKNLEMDVTDEVGTYYLESIAAEISNDRKNTRPERHTLLSSFDYEDVKYFSDSTDLLADLIDSEFVSRALSCLNDRQQYLIRKCFLEGWSYSDLARTEGKDESAIRKAVDRAKTKLKKYLS